MTKPTDILAPIETMEQQRADLYAKLVEFKEKIESLSSALAGSIASGGELEFEEADEVRSRRKNYRERVEDLERAIALLDAEIESGREEAIRRGFSERITEIEVRAAELAAEIPDRQQALEALREQVAEAEAEIGRSRRLTGLLRAEGALLSDLTGLPQPEIDARYADRPLPAIDATTIPIRQLRRIDSALGSLGEESPSLALLEASGGGPDKEEWHRMRMAQNRARIEGRAEEYEQARNRVDAWLREALAEGPVLRDRLIDRGLAAGFPLMKDPAQADLSAARHRVGVVILRRRPQEHAQPDPRSWWGLPGRFDEERMAPTI